MLFTGSRYIVAGVTLLIAYIALTSQIFVFVPWLMSISLKRTFQVLVPFNIGVGFIYWHYYLACTTEPGSPPPGWGETEPLESESRNAKEDVAEGTIDAAGHSTATDLLKAPTVSGLKDRTKPRNAITSSFNIATTLNKHNGILKDSSDQKISKKMRRTPLPRYCRTCEGFKPPRSHHCRICKKCVLKMDHHCPWINNCVGYFNYGHFIRFITWVTITTSFCLILLIWRIVDAIQYETYYMYRNDGPTKVQIIFMAVNIFVDGGVLLAVGILCIYHLWSMISNTSTIEVWEKEKVEAMIKKGKIRMIKFPYDVGCFRNYRQVLGPSLWLWLWPQPMLGSGTEFDVMEDKDAALIWPPREYQTSKRQDRTFVSEYTSSSIHYRQMRQQQPRSPSQSQKHSSPLTSLHHDDKKQVTSGADYRLDETKDSMSRRDRRSKLRRKSQQPSPPEFPTHVRRGSEGWIVQDLTVHQRAELYDRQMQYQREQERSNEREGRDGGYEDEEQDYQEGLSDIEGNDTYGRLPGGMQGNYYNSYHQAYENEDSHHDDDQEQVQSSDEDDDDDDIPYDVASDEYDDDGYGDVAYDDYDGEEDYFDENNPYLAYGEDDDDEEDEEDTRVDEADFEDEEVALHGRDRHKIGRFFDHINPSSTTARSSSTDDGGEDGLEDEWDEGEGVDVGCRPPAPAHSDSSSSLRYDPTKKTFYTMLVEREQALKRQKKRAAGGRKSSEK
ncbi:Palmitoyltransferase [Mortierella sp. GBA30]|nr:Palmitoyltransferase [Mortierella sp. GBA30]